MGTLLEELIVKYTADTNDLKSGLKSVKSDMSSVSSAAKESTGFLKGVFGGMLSMAGAIGVTNLASDAFGYLKDAVKGAYDESVSAQEGMAQTVQVLKSTHDASGMTAQAISDLAGEESHLTRFSDDTTQAAENMLLTFTNIGKNVFPQATKTVLDMSQALGQDTKSSAIQLGKALNDPIAGITALSRVGVTFDDQQKKLIKTYMEHNQVAKAQGVILKELQKEFGGSAEAAGKTFPGQLDILKQHLADVEQNVGDALMPLLTQFTGYVGSTILPVVGRFSDWFVKYGVPVIQKFASVIGTDAQDAVQGLGSFIADDLLPPAKQIFNVAGDIITNFIKWNEKTHFLQNTMRDVGNLIGRVSESVATKLMPPVRDAIAAFQQWLGKSNFVHDALGQLGDVIDTVVGVIGKLIGDLASVFDWFGKSKDRAGFLRDAIFAIGGVIAGVKILQFGKDVATSMSSAVTSVKNVVSAIGDIKDKASTVFSYLHDTFGPKTKDVLSGSEGVEGSAGKASTAVEGIGTAATTSEAEVAVASTAEEGELSAVDASAKTAEADIAGIGPAAGASSISATGAFAGFAAGVVTAGIGAIIGIEAYMLKDALPALWRSWWDSSYKPPSGPGGTNPARNNQHAQGLTNNPMGHEAVVGEEGPERMWVPGGASIYSHEKSMRMGSYPIRQTASSAGSSASSSGGSSSGGNGDHTTIIEWDGVEIARHVQSATDRLVRLKLGARGRAA